MVDNQHSSGFQLSLVDTSTKVKVTSPFQLEVLSADTTVLQINSRALLKFEHLRIKP